MKLSPSVATFGQRIKHTGYLLLCISLLMLLAGGVGFLLCASSPLGSQIAGNTGDIHVGSDDALLPLWIPLPTPPTTKK